MLDWCSNYARQQQFEQHLLRDGYSANEASVIAERLYTRMRHRTKRWVKEQEAHG